jgi:F-type H+-transporting ATPase subunit b
MGLVSPNPGTIIWMLLTFGIVVYILTRFAWKPILNALKERESSIRDALNSAETARKQMEELKSNQDMVRANTIREKETILNEARSIKDKIIAEAKDQAQQEGAKLMMQIREQIENEKEAALLHIKEQVAELSVRIAEKILQEKLESNQWQEKIIQSQLEDFKLN